MVKRPQSQMLKVQWKPLNVITLGQTTRDHINRMQTISDEFYLLIFSEWDKKSLIHLAVDNINHVITLSGLHSIK